MLEFLKVAGLWLRVLYFSGTLAKSLQLIIDAVRVVQAAGLINDPHVDTAAKLLEKVEPWVKPNGPVAVTSLPPTQVVTDENTVV